MLDDTGDVILWGILAMYAVWAMWAIYQAWGKRVSEEDMKWLDSTKFHREHPDGTARIIHYPIEEDNRDAEREARHDDEV